VWLRRLAAMTRWLVHGVVKWKALLLAAALGLSSCSPTSPPVRGPVGMVIGGSVELRRFANPEVRARLLPGIREAEIVNLIGCPDRRRSGPAREQWVWDQEVAVSGEHLAMLLDIQDGCQVGPAVFVQVQKPRWMMYAGCLLIGMTPNDVVSGLGAPYSRRQGEGELTYTWRSSLHLRVVDGRLWYSGQRREHSLRATFRRGRLVDVRRDSDAVVTCRF